MADRAGIDPDDYRDYAGDLNTHEFISAINTALGVDIEG